MATNTNTSPLRSTDRIALLDEIRRIEGGFGNAHQRLHIPTGIDVLDDRLQGGGIAAGAIHELWSSDDGSGLWTMATWLARQAAARGGFIFWFDERKDFYPPAARAHGIDLNRLVLLRPRERREMLWSMGQALRCRGVAAVVGSLRKLNRPEVRRLQLAAESSGGIGILLASQATDVAAGGVASRWRVMAAPSSGDERRFTVEIEKCRGGRAIPPILLEAGRGKILVAVSTRMADRPNSKKVADSPAA